MLNEISKDAKTFIHSYLKQRKQYVKINNTESFFSLLLSGIPQGTVLGVIIFNIFINDFFLFIKEANLANFFNDSTIYASSKDIDKLINS